MFDLSTGLSNKLILEKLKSLGFKFTLKLFNKGANCRMEPHLDCLIIGLHYVYTIMYLLSSQNLGLD